MAMRRVQYSTIQDRHHISLVRASDTLLNYPNKLTLSWTIFFPSIASSLKIALWCVLFKDSVTSPSLKIIEQQLTSSSSSSCPFHLSFNNLYQKEIHTQDSTNSLTLLRFVYTGCFLLHQSRWKNTSIFHMTGLTYRLHSSPASRFKRLKEFQIHFPKDN